MAVYYPSVKEKDAKTGQYIYLYPSITLSEIFTKNDNNAFPWIAAAGEDRGTVINGYSTYKPLSLDMRDTLYSNNINPIATFYSQGERAIKIWGNKTSQKAKSALSDVNVRRLLIEGKKFVSSVSRKLLFEPLEGSLYTRFKDECTPYFDNIKANKGLNIYRIVMDDTTTTPDDKDNNTLNGYIQLQPTKATEIINIGFQITGQGNFFAEI
jgi:phage tail sheath protein FI